MKKIILIAMAIIAASLTANVQAQKTESKVKNLTYSEFMSKIWDFERNPSTCKYRGRVPAVVDFYADWCGPCRRVAPILEKLAEEYDGRVVIYKVNVDKERELAAAFEVKNIPTMFFFPMNGQPSKQIGATAEEVYRRNIESMLSKNEASSQEFKNSRGSEPKALEFKE